MILANMSMNATELNEGLHRYELGVHYLVAYLWTLRGLYILRRDLMQNPDYSSRIETISSFNTFGPPWGGKE